MTIEEIDRLQEAISFWKGVGNSSKFPVHINKMEALLALARGAAAMSELERAAARRAKRRAA